MSLFIENCDVMNSRFLTLFDKLSTLEVFFKLILRNTYEIDSFYRIYTQERRVQRPTLPLNV